MPYSISVFRLLGHHYAILWHVSSLEHVYKRCTDRGLTTVHTCIISFVHLFAESNIFLKISYHIFQKQFPLHTCTYICIGGGTVCKCLDFTYSITLPFSKKYVSTHKHVQTWVYVVGYYLHDFGNFCQQYSILWHVYMIYIVCVQTLQRDVPTIQTITGTFVHVCAKWKFGIHLIWHFLFY